MSERLDEWYDLIEQHLPTPVDGRVLAALDELYDLADRGDYWRTRCLEARADRDEARRELDAVGDWDGITVGAGPGKVIASGRVVWDCKEEDSCD